MIRPSLTSLFFFFNDTATTEIYTLSLHDALPISKPVVSALRGPDLSSIAPPECPGATVPARSNRRQIDRKSTRLNSSHQIISYAVFCLKKKKKHIPKHVNTIVVSLTVLRILVRTS